MLHKVQEVNYILNLNLKLQVNTKVLVPFSIIVSQILNTKTGNLSVIAVDLLTSAKITHAPPKYDPAMHHLAYPVHTTNGSYPFEVQLNMQGPTCLSGSSQIQCYLNLSVL